MPFVAVPDKNSGDVFTTAMWTTFLEGNLNAGVSRPLVDQILVAPAAAIDVPSIPQTFASLVVRLQARGDTAATFTPVAIRFNNDSSAVYNYELLAPSNVSVVSAGTLNAASLSLGTITALNSPASAAGTSVAEIVNYTGTTFFKEVIATNGFESADTAAGQGSDFVHGYWKSTAAINRITIIPGAGNFIAGSRLTIYGMGFV